MIEKKKTGGAKDRGKHPLSPLAYAAISLAAIIIGIGLLLLFVFKADDLATQGDNHRSEIKGDTARARVEKSAEKSSEEDPYEDSELYKKASGYSRDKKIDQALDVLDDEEIDKEEQENRVGCYILKAQLHMKKNQFQEAETYYQKAKSLAVTDSQKAEIFSNLGDLHRDGQDFSKALDAYNEALNIYRRLANKKPNSYLKYLAWTLTNKGILYLNNPDYETTTFPKDAFDEALKIYEQLVVENREAYNPKAAKVYHNLAVYYKKKRNYSEAEEAYGKALRIEEILVNENAKEYLPSLAGTYNDLALLYWTRDLERGINYSSEAVANFKNAVEIYRRLKNENPTGSLHDMSMSRALANLGNFYRDADKFDEALDAYNEALKIRERLAGENPDVYELELGKILFLMSYLYLRKIHVDQENESSYKREGLILINRAITFYERYRDKTGVEEILGEAKKIKRIFEN
jgi:tetratricopeptide (TPR) repeat protein